MPSFRKIAHDLLLRARWILTRSILAAALAAIVSLALPLEWESTALLLPPDRRTDSFRYEIKRSGLRRVLESFRLRDSTHPIEIYQALLASAETGRRVVERFDLASHWGVRTNEEAVRRLFRALTVEPIPYGGIEIRVTMDDRELAATVANGAAEILETRLTELYENDVRWESEFLTDAIRENREELERADRELARHRVLAGIAAPDLQQEELSGLTVELAIRLARARTELGQARRSHGKNSPQALDAARRVKELEQAAGSLSSLGAGSSGDEIRRQEIDRIEETSRLLTSLQDHMTRHRAAHAGGIRILDSAAPAGRPSVTPILMAAVLAALMIPGTVVARTFHPHVRATLQAQAWSPAAERVVSRVLGFLDAVFSSPLPRSVRPAALLAAAVLAGVLFARVPLVLAALLGVLFLVILTSDRVAAWLILVAALPWAWDYLNWHLGFEIQFPTEPGIILFAVFWSYSLALRGRLRVTGSPLLSAILLTVVWIALSSVTSVDLRHSLFQTVAVSGFVIVGALFPIFEIRRVETIERVIRIYLVCATLLAIYGLIQTLSSSLPLDRAAFWMGQGFLYNHGPFTAYLGFALGPAIVYVVTSRTSIRSTPLLLATALLTVATVVSLTRAAWVAVAALLLVVAAARSRHFLRTITIPLLGATLVVGGVLATSPTMTQAFQRYLERSVSADYGSNLERLNRWQAAARMVIARPFTGVGPSAYETAYPVYRDASFVSQLSGRKMGAHSDLIRTAAEQGLPGVVILIVLVGLFYRTGIRLMRTGSDAQIRRLAAAICAGMFTYTIHGLFNEYWRLPKIAFTLWIFVGLLGALERIEAERKRSPEGVEFSSQVTM